MEEDEAEADGGFPLALRADGGDCGDGGDGGDENDDETLVASSHGDRFLELVVGASSSSSSSSAAAAAVCVFRAALRRGEARAAVVCGFGLPLTHACRGV